MLYNIKKMFSSVLLVLALLFCNNAFADIQADYTNGVDMQLLVANALTENPELTLEELTEQLKALGASDDYVAQITEVFNAAAPAGLGGGGAGAEGDEGTTFSSFSPSAGGGVSEN